MSQVELINYIRQNAKDGFSKKEIRNALFAAGWNSEEVDLAFLSIKDSKRQLLRTIALIIITPLIGFGSAWLYQTSRPDATSDAGPNVGEVSGVSTETIEEKQTRDQQRISDIAALQTALEKYFSSHQLYPKNLSVLIAENLITSVPLDPKNKEPYLYSALGEPPLYYSLSFLLETKLDSLQKGFNSVNSENRISSQ